MGLATPCGDRRVDEFNTHPLHRSLIVSRSDYGFVGLLNCYLHGCPCGYYGDPENHVEGPRTPTCCAVHILGRIPSLSADLVS